MIESYLQALERDLHLAAHETREILMEVRGSLQDARLQLERGGMSPSEAEHEAVARFGNTRVLAMALRRAHGCFPLPLRLLSIALLALGALGLTLEALSAPAAFQLATQPATFSEPWIITVLAIPLGLAALSFAAGACGLWKGRRGRVGAAVRVWLWLGLVVDILLIIAVWPAGSPTNVRAQSSAYGNLDVSIDVPNLALLQAAGRVARPDRGQPASPVRVEYVAVDSATTYVRYDVREPGHAEQVYPRLHDEQGQEYPLRSAVVIFSHAGGLYSLLPWAWTMPPRGVAIFDAVPADTTALTLDFYSVEGAGTPNSSLWDPYYFLTNRLYDTPAATLARRYGPYTAPALLETVRVPVHLRPLLKVRTAHPRQETTLKGIGVRVETVTTSLVDTQIAYVITSSPVAQVGNPGFPELADSLDRKIAYTLRIDDSFHGRTAITAPGYNFYPFQAPLPDGKIHYQCSIVLPPQRAGTQLLLSFPILQLTGLPAVQGPWRLWVTMP